MKPDLSVEIAGLRLRNPTMLSAGILGLSGMSLRRAWEAGTGAVVTKSLGLKPRNGFPNPTIVDVGYGFLNAMGLPNPGVEEYAKEIRIARIDGDITIIGSVYGGSPREFAEAAKSLEKAGVDAVELNVSCPHVEDVGMEVGRDPRYLMVIVRAVKDAVTLPVFTKLTPNVSNIGKLAEAVEAAGTDGITAINTLRAMAIDVETGRPILSNRIGGLSGPAIKPVALRCVYEIARKVNVPIIGCGGVVDWKDAVEFLLAGASAVQIGTAIAYKDLEVFGEIVEGIRKYLKIKRCRSVDEVVGLSHSY